MRHVAAQVTALIVLSSSSALACPVCRPAVESDVYNQDFTITLLTLLSPLMVLFMIAIGLYHLDDIMAKLNHIMGD